MMLDLHKSRIAESIKLGGDVARNFITRAYNRDEHASMDEAKIVLAMLGPVNNGVVLDVGSHYGNTSKLFAGAGYTCHAFEPDPVNREKLLKETNNLSVYIDPRAISNAVTSNQPFFRSPESSGISSLTSFRETHREYCNVSTTTIDAYCLEKGIERIDFLKIDTEGFDLMALQGVPWDRIIPSVVLCEFEDLKTVPLGYDYHQMAQFLTDKGYTVFVSEWHPIIRYGISHDWHRFVKYPHELSSINAWGNLLAFRVEPDMDTLSSCVNSFILTRPEKNNAYNPFIASGTKVAAQTSITEASALQSPSKFKQFVNAHKGQRCVIIGNGPSLNRMDLSFLENEITFGMNRVYLLFDKWRFRPTYYVSVNPLVLEQSFEEIEKIPVPKFLGSAAKKYFHDRADIFFLENLPEWTFSYNPAAGISEGWTVTYVAMQLAYYMGFSEVVLIGVDHHFITQGDPNKEVVSLGPDPNHFHPDYFGNGVRWHLPDLERSEKSYRMAKTVFEADGRQIIDATVDGRLTIFPKADYHRIFFDPKVALMNKLSELIAQYTGDPSIELGFNLVSRLRMIDMHSEADIVAKHIQSLIHRK